MFQITQTVQGWTIIALQCTGLNYCCAAVRRAARARHRTETARTRWGWLPRTCVQSPAWRHPAPSRNRSCLPCRSHFTDPHVILIVWPAGIISKQMIRDQDFACAETRWRFCACMQNVYYQHSASYKIFSLRWAESFWRLYAGTWRLQGGSCKIFIEILLGPSCRCCRFLHEWLGLVWWFLTH